MKDRILKVLIVGSGGREDALAWKFQQEDDVQKVYVTPGHAGMERFSKVEVLDKKSNEEIVVFCESAGVDLVVVGPEAPLTAGLVNLLEDAGVLVFGPRADAAQLEGSKIFSKEFMKRHNIPTADYRIFDNYDDAIKGLAEWDISQGIVIKVDGLAGGKGVVVTFDEAEARQSLHDFMVNPDVNVKTERILFEKVLPGEEVSAFALCLGTEFVFLGTACDHKRVGDDDTGPNTGGMGCYWDKSWPDEILREKITEKVLKPTLNGMQAEGHSFKGFLFMGLMVDSEGEPFVVEYNVRMGDPETQTLLPLVENNLAAFLFHGLEEKTWSGLEGLKLKDLASVHVVATSQGYPSLGAEPMDLGHSIKIGFDDNSQLVFYAGVSRDPRDNGLMNTGGRVLGVTALGADLSEARDKAYELMDQVDFKGMHYRQDIGARQRGQG